jgi:hypothetical protein
MNAWVPLLQTALWVGLIAVLVFRYHAQLGALISALQKRIEGGSSLKAGPFELGEGAKPQSVAAQKERLSDESSTTGTQVLAAPRRTISKSRYLLAEDLVMRKLQAEFGVPIKRQMALGPDARFDGLFTKKDSAFGVEVKYLSRKPLSKDLVGIFQQAVRYVGNLDLNRFTLILVFVFESEDLMSPDVIRTVQGEASLYGEKVVVRLYAFRDLASEFGLSLDDG